MDRAMRLLFAGGLTLLICSLLFTGWLYFGRPKGGSSPNTPATLAGPKLSIPRFTLVNQRGEATDQSLLDGRVSIVWFMFTNCPIACPAMTVQMVDLQRELKSQRVQFVAFSLDAAQDTPAVLSEYAQRYEIDISNWTFVTGSAKDDGETIRRIFAQDLAQHVQDTPESMIPVRGGGQMANIEHGVNFFLVGPDRSVLGWFNANRPQEMAALREQAVRAAAFYAGRP